MAEILDGLKVSKEIKQEIKAEVEKNSCQQEKSAAFGSHSCGKQRSK